jgi:hypothetical protein
MEKEKIRLLAIVMTSQDGGTAAAPVHAPKRGGGRR